jgi:XTP/dITP diphosphohydrolase
MKQLVFATSNTNKVKEIQHIMGSAYNFLSLADIGCTEDIPETQDTILGNALQKARYVYRNYSKNCFSEDTGLLIESLDGAPGVYSARYAGPQKSASDNMAKVLKELNTASNRKAYFKTVIALIIDGQEYIFEGEVQGVILYKGRGNQGFGYDPIFQPEGFEKSFGQMTISEKDQISHRARATAQLKKFLSV